MAATTRSLVLAILTICAIVIQVPASGTVWVRFRKYLNPSGKAANGHCCDGRWGICQRGGCDYTFNVCLGYDHSSSECRYGRYRSRPLFNHVTYIFGRLFGGVRNPMEFHFNAKLTMPVVLKVDVYDRDILSRDEFVDSFHIGLISQHLRTAPTGLVLEGRTRLIATSRLVCDMEWFVPPNCNVFCAKPSHSYMHFTCDPDTGKQVCDTGWTGDNCTVPQTLTLHPAVTTTATSHERVVFVDRENADCHRLSMNGVTLQDGTYFIHVGQLDPFLVVCDISTGGWTVIQQRVDGSESFSRGWDEYKVGFGVVGKGKDYWLGLEKIYQLTNQRKYKLRVTVVLGSGESLYAEYEHFWIEDETHLYRLHVDGYNGTAGDALAANGVFHGSRSHYLAPFSTFDRDNDNWSQGSCATQYHSGWWFNDCYWANLNGFYVNEWSSCPDGRCVTWLTIPGYEEFSLVATKMEVLPNPSF